MEKPLKRKCDRALAAAIFVAVAAVAQETPPDPFAPLTPIAAAPGAVDIGRTALVAAQCTDPAVNVEASLARLDALAAELKPALAKASTPREQLETMRQVIFDRWGFGDGRVLPPDVFVSFTDVLEKRQWNCFGLTLLYVALGERMDLPLAMVSGRGHALVHLRNSPFFVETTQKGAVHDDKNYLATYLPYPCTDPREYTLQSDRETVAVLLTQTGVALEAQARYIAAKSCYSHALRFDPIHAEALAALGFHEFRAGAADRAEEWFRKAITADPSLREAYGGLGAVLHARGDLRGAADAFRKAASLCADMPEPWFNLGQIFYELTEYAESAAAYRSYIRLAPNDPDGHFRIAFPLEDGGRLDEALAAYSEALRLLPNHVDAMVNSGAIYEKKNDSANAQRMYEKALSVNHQNPLAHAGLGRVSAKQGRFDEAEQAFATAAKLDPGNPAVWIDYAKLDRKTGNVSGAIEKLQRALLLNPAEPETHIELAVSYAAIEDDENAARHAATAVKLGATLPEELRKFANPTPE